MDNNLSIHPRNWPQNRGRDDNRKSRDCTKPHKGKGKLGKKLRKLNQRQKDRDQTVKSPQVKNAMAYKAPGSMNQHKRP